MFAPAQALNQVERESDIQDPYLIPLMVSLNQNHVNCATWKPMATNCRPMYKVILCLVFFDDMHLTTVGSLILSRICCAVFIVKNICGNICFYWLITRSIFVCGILSNASTGNWNVYFPVFYYLCAYLFCFFSVAFWITFATLEQHNIQHSSRWYQTFATQGIVGHIWL